ncbi:MAG: serine hydrolase [Ferruginibacter sp.]|nr:serine hydrolase [Cytophagales bacterium]
MRQPWPGNHPGRPLFLLALLLLGLFFSSSTVVIRTDPSPPERTATQWADSVFNRLSEEERIGQLFMVAAYSNGDRTHFRQLDSLIVKQHVGGLVFFQGGPVRQAQLTNRYQSLAKVPLLMAMDAEWGLGMRLDSVLSYPRQMTLGAIGDNRYVYDMGAEIARQCRRLGVHVNFAPVVDINSNADNPVIGSRSFGETKEDVATKGIAYMKGLQHHGVLAIGKHFPGHGDTGTDSHFTLPVIRHPKDRLNNLELYPFRQLIADSLMGVLVAHIHVPAFDNRKNVATTLSANVVTKLLKEDLGFQGLVFTDALNMRGVSKFHKPGEVDLLALLAGNDVLLMSENVPAAVRIIQRAVAQQRISGEEIARRVKKILRAKFWAGLHQYQPVQLEGLHADLNSARAQRVKHDLYERAVTLVRNQGNLLPFTLLDTTTFASVSIGLDTAGVFQATLDQYASFRHFTVPSKRAGEAVYDQILEKVKGFDAVVVSLHRLNSSDDRGYGIPSAALDFIAVLQKKTKVVVTVFGSAYSLKHFNQSDFLLCAYEDNSSTQRIVPQVLFGALPARGKLPVSANKLFPAGSGLFTEGLGRLQYDTPESVGMNAEFLAGIDQVIDTAIRSRAMPGCQVLVARRGKVVFQKSYGFLAYDSLQPVTDQTLYDIASVTKVAGTLQATMFLYDRGLLDLNQTVAFYLPDLKGTNKEGIVMRDLLMHQAGLTPHIPFWQRTRSRNGLSAEYYRSVADSAFSLGVARGLYTRPSVRDSVWKWIVGSPLNFKPKKATHYSPQYSDLSFLIVQRVVEKLLNQPLDEFLAQQFYEPLGLTLTYNPLRRLPADRLAPTEDDRLFRRELLRGTVHDEGAALLGGVAGHAGLFSNAHDLAVLMQMNLQKGYYGGKRYLQPETVPTFIKSYQPGNRRGLGWDRPDPNGGGYVSDFASRNSFGHSGFTGTLVWVDPDAELVYVFLCNRIHPDASNQRLAKQTVRRRVQDIIYKSVINYQVLSERK